MTIYTKAPQAIASKEYVLSLKQGVRPYPQQMQGASLAKVTIPCMFSDR
jgi:hypothetical protein